MRGALFTKDLSPLSLSLSHSLSRRLYFSSFIRGIIRFSGKKLSRRNCPWEIRMVKRSSILPMVYFLLFITFLCGEFAIVYTGNVFYHNQKARFHKSDQWCFGYVAVIDASIVLIWTPTRQSETFHVNDKRFSTKRSMKHAACTRPALHTQRIRYSSIVGKK